MSSGLKIIHFQHPYKKEAGCVVYVFSKHSKQKLQEVTDRIANELLNEESQDWTYEDEVEKVVREMIKQGYLEPLDFDVERIKIYL